MHTIVDLNGYRESEDGTELKVLVPNLLIGDMLVEKHIKKAEMRFDDGRAITSEQRRKAYALINDISSYTGYLPEETKDYMKQLYFAKTGEEKLSLADCTITQAREFINTLMEFAIENGVQLSDLGVNLTDDMSRYLYFCIMNKRCAICGRYGEIHHQDAIGRGYDRRKVDDSKKRKICLCREHHTQAHNLGNERFMKMYHVEGIIVKNIKAVEDEG